jgi:tetratricopeptide (TPR) repeat protein
MTKASLHWQMGATDEALATWAIAVERLRASRHAEGLCQALKTLGDVMVGLNRPAQARSYLEEAVELFAQLEDYEGAATVWSRIGHVHEELGDYPAAMAAWGKGRTICQRLANASLELEIVEGMARFTRVQVPEPSLALQYYREAVALARAAGLRDREGEIRNTTAIVEWERGRYAEALEEYYRSEECFREAGEPAKIGLILNSIGVTLHKLGRLEAASSQLRAAVKHN